MFQLIENITKLVGTIVDRILCCYITIIKWLNSKHSWLVEVPHVYVTTKNYFWHSDPHQLTVCDNLSDVYVDILSGILSDRSGLLFDIYSDIYISSWHFVSGILYLAFYLTYCYILTWLTFWQSFWHWAAGLGLPLMLPRLPDLPGASGRGESVRRRY